MINIVHIITSMDSGGAEKMLLRLLKYSDNKKINHKVITLNKIGFYENELKTLNIDVLELDIKSKLKSFKGIIDLNRSIKCFLKDADLIKTWMYHANIIGLIYAQLLKKRVVWGIRRSYVEKENTKRGTYLFIKLNSFFSKRADAILFNSKNGIETHKKIGIRGKKNLYIPNGFEINDLETMKNDTNTLRVINVARWEKLKDHDTLLKACSLFKENNPDVNFNLTLCGKNISVENQVLVNLIEKYNLQSDVKLLGERKDIETLMQNSDVYISSSISEGFPNVVAEAMVNGLICIGTNAGETSEIINNEKYVVKVGDYQEISRILKSITLMDEKEKVHIKEANRNSIIERYSVEKIVDMYLSVFQKILLKGE